MGKAIILPGTADPQAATESGLQQLIGQNGEAVTDLRPAGIALIGSRRVDVVSRGVLLDAGSFLRVIRVEGNRVVVEAAADQSTTTGAEPPESAQPSP